MNLNKLLIGGLLVLSFVGCGENFQGNYVGTATVDNLNCSVVAGQYDIRVHAQISGNIDLQIIQMVQSSTKQTNNITDYLMDGLRMRVPFVGNGQFSETMLRVFKNSDVDNVDVSGTMNDDRSELSSLKIKRVKVINTQTEQACTLTLNAPLLKRE